MALKVIGAGLGRTGTHSLQLALQQLLGGPCYHMLEVIADPEVKVQQWMDAMDGNADWDDIMKGYVASVDWPAAAFWRELADKYPDAPVLLSTRASTEQWFKSFSSTILEVMLRDAAQRRLADATAHDGRAVHARLEEPRRVQGRVRQAQRRGARRRSLPTG